MCGVGRLSVVSVFVSPSLKSVCLCVWSIVEVSVSILDNLYFSISLGQICNTNAGVSSFGHHLRTATSTLFEKLSVSVSVKL